MDGYPLYCRPYPRLHRVGQRSCNFEIAVPEKWIGKTVIEADVRKKHGINIMAIKRDGKMNLNFVPETSFIPGNTILVLGDTKNIQKCFHI